MIRHCLWKMCATPGASHCIKPGCLARRPLCYKVNLSCLLKLQALGKNHTISLPFTTYSLYATLTFKYARNIYLSHEPSILPPQLLPVRLQTYRTHSPKLRLPLVYNCEMTNEILTKGSKIFT